MWINKAFKYKILVNTVISNIKYKSSFYLFNNQFDYILTYYFAKLKTIKKNVNKF